MFPKSAHHICLMHIEVNVRKRALSLIGNKIFFEEYMRRFNEAISAPAESEWNKRWQAMEQDYQSYPALLSYTKSTWINHAPKGFFLYTPTKSSTLEPTPQVGYKYIELRRKGRRTRNRLPSSNGNTDRGLLLAMEEMLANMEKTKDGLIGVKQHHKTSSQSGKGLEDPLGELFDEQAKSSSSEESGRRRIFIRPGCRNFKSGLTILPEKIFHLSSHVMNWRCVWLVSLLHKL
ncbi:hypothetical protein LIER_20526 [Lithospermum erythrorhizon]|uniref:Protein FAR1-RELATED SEQUENCE n=1 Tax=Lithospermum erythrorhizon TaxID=34254 RepID=A0AAV3QMV9_LITER